jgi:SAM-dependent methyltransferase
MNDPMKSTRDDPRPGKPQPGAGTWKEIERHGWHRNARHYDARAGRMTAKAVAPMLRAVQARPGMRLLDVCCGPGYGAGMAAAGGLEAVGIDLAAAMVQEARGRFPSAAFHEGDAENLDFPAGSFDAVICAFGMLHLTESAKAISEGFRVLAVGGRYAFTVWCEPEKARLLGLALAAVTEHANMNVPLPAAPPMFKFSDPGVAKAELEAAGFVEVGVEDIPIEFVGQSPGDVFDWLEKSTVRTMALFRLQTPEVQQRIKAAILHRAREFSAGGEVRIPCPARLYSARKSH